MSILGAFPPEHKCFLFEEIYRKKKKRDRSEISSTCALFARGCDKALQVSRVIFDQLAECFCANVEELGVGVDRSISRWSI